MTTGCGVVWLSRLLWEQENRRFESCHPDQYMKYVVDKRNNKILQVSDKELGKYDLLSIYATHSEALIALSNITDCSVCKILAKVIQGERGKDAL